MGKKYQRRASDLVRNRIVTLLRRKANDPRLLSVTITDVVVTPDAARATVYYSVLGDADERAVAQIGLNSAAGWLRREMGRTLRLRNTPELIFHYDSSMERGEQIDRILDGLKLTEHDSKDDTSES